MNYEFRTPHFVVFTVNKITNFVTRTNASDYQTATALLLIATKEEIPCVVFKGYPGDKVLNRDNFNDYFRRYL